MPEIDEFEDKKVYFAGLLGYYEQTLSDIEHNKKVEIANCFVDVYNKTVHFLPKERQLEYQKDIKTQCENLLSI